MKLVDNKKRIKMGKITGRKIKFAFVGCGRISKNHFGSFETHNDNIEV